LVSDPRGCRSARPTGVVAYRRPRFCVAHSVGVDDIAGVAVLSLSARIKDLLPDWRSALVGWLPCHAICVDRCLLALGAAIVPCTSLLAYVGR
jgi:hypothetical protein